MPLPIEAPLDGWRQWGGFLLADDHVAPVRAGHECRGHCRVAAVAIDYLVRDLSQLIRSGSSRRINQLELEVGHDFGG